ncbi:DUF2264 domain-containing protein [Aquihabitans sp. McL0605]|uniref:DUF2264 domain-containing protein n=1 Tax=Aquihabitans sp. McL0605 TaxID=3415671 RepID=UPI003CF2A931
MPPFDVARLGGNPLALGPLETRAHLQRAVLDLHRPLGPRTSRGGARVRVGSGGALFDQAAAELEGFARPLYGIVPLVVGGGAFHGWDRICAGLEAGTNPGSDEYWGPVEGDLDQRMVEQAAIGLALAFCPECTWDHLGPVARERLVTWLWGIFDHDPANNNWQFFRILVALGLQRVGQPFAIDKVEESYRLLETFRRGHHWYVDGELENVDYYVPFAFHTYGLICAAASDVGLGNPGYAELYRERAAGFAADFRHWFAADGAAIPVGRSLTYRFAMSSFWGALAWADVASPVPWGEAKGHTLRNLRWWSDKAISEADGLLSVGYTYANRTLAESYNSPGSPYWCMKAFLGLAAPADHPYWADPELAAPAADAPVTLTDPGWVVTRDDDQAVALVARPGWPIEFPEQAGAKYRKFAYSSAFGFSADVPDVSGTYVTDSTLALTDAEGNRRARLGVDVAGVEDAMSWSTWYPWPDVRVDSVCFAVDGRWHGRLHQIRTARRLRAVETGFAVGYSPTRHALTAAAAPVTDRAALTTEHGTTALIGLPALGEERTGWVAAVAVNANLIRPNAAVPALACALGQGVHRLGALVYASPSQPLPDERPDVPDAATALLDRIIHEDLP